MSEALNRFWAEKDAQAAERQSKQTSVTLDPILAEIELMRPYLDEVDRGRGKAKPTDLMKIAYCMTAAKSPKAARRQFEVWQAESRRRWRAGFCATPFGEPVKRKMVAL